jgi:hypothetical protein
LQEKIDAIKNHQNVSPADKQKVLKSLKENFGKVPHMKDYFDKLVA